MANLFCANCSWQGNAIACPNCGEATESLYVEEHSGMPGAYELEFATSDLSAQVGYQDVEVESSDDDF